MPNIRGLLFPFFTFLSNRFTWSGKTAQEIITVMKRSYERGEDIFPQKITRGQTGQQTQRSRLPAIIRMFLATSDHAIQLSE